MRRCLVFTKHLPCARFHRAGPLNSLGSSERGMFLPPFYLQRALRLRDVREPVQGHTERVSIGTARGRVA